MDPSLLNNLKQFSPEKNKEFVTDHKVQNGYENETEQQQTSVLIVNEKNVQVSPKSEDVGNIEVTYSSNDEHEAQLDPVDDSENVNANNAQNAISPPADSIDTVQKTKLDPLAKPFEPESFKESADDDEEEDVSESSNINSATSNSLTDPMDLAGKNSGNMPAIDEYEEQISPLSTDNDQSTTVASVSYLMEPTKSEMQAPRPMINRMDPSRRHSYGYCFSRTDLQIEADYDETTTSGEDEDDYQINDALESSSGGEPIDVDMDDDDDVMDKMHTSICSPSPIKNVSNRSSDFYNELQQRKTAMDSHYIIPHQYRVYMLRYFAFFIGVLVILLIAVPSSTFDKEPKYINIPKTNKFFFLREECQNVNHYDMDFSASYAANYGYEFVDTVHYKYHDGVHWMVLSVICIAAIFIIYPLILFLNAALLIFRHSYYKNHGIDPLFFCGFCPIYQRYSSPNAPHLSSVLDPNNLYLFNHNFSPSISPELKVRKEEKVGSAPKGLSVVNEEEFFDDVDDKNDKESTPHLMVVEPERSLLPQSDDSNEEEMNVNREHNRTASEVLKETLLPFNMTLFSPNSNCSQSPETTMIVEDSTGIEHHF